jgi:hypothetical protein
MPRKTPVSTADLSIGKRLAHLRMDAQFSREELAVRAGLSPGLIARVELGRMPLRYSDGKVLLRALSPSGLAWPDLRPVNPLWLTEGMEPATVDWPLVLPQIQHLGVDFSASYCHVIKSNRDLIIRLVQDPTTVKLPESWLAAYCNSWENLHLKAKAFQQDAAIVERLLRASCEQLASASTVARGILHDYRAALAEPVVIPRRWNAEQKSSNLVLTHDSEDRNIATMQMRELLGKVRKLTSARGMKVKLAAALHAPLPRISEWLSGKYAPSGQTTLRLLQWVEQQEREQTKSPGSATTQPRLKTRPQKSHEKDSESGPPKG